MSAVGLYEKMIARFDEGLSLLRSHDFATLVLDLQYIRCCDDFLYSYMHMYSVYYNTYTFVNKIIFSLQINALYKLALSSIP